MQLEKNPSGNNQSNPALLKVREVAAVLGIGRNATYDLIHEGRIASIHVGRNIYVPRWAIDKFLESAA